MSIKRYPPRLCPICKERLWFEERIFSVDAWHYYDVHVHRYHLEFEKFEKRASRFLWVGIAIVFSSLLLLARLVAPPANLILAGVIVLIFVILVFRMNRGGRRKFRDLWNQEHGASGSP